MKNSILAICMFIFSGATLAEGQFDGIWQKDGTSSFTSIHQGATDAQGVSTMYQIEVTHTGGLSGSWDGLAIIKPVPALNVLTQVTVTSAYGTKVKNVIFTSLTTATSTSVSCTPSDTAPAGWCGSGGGVRTHTKLPL